MKQTSQRILEASDQFAGALSGSDQTAFLKVDTNFYCDGFLRLKTRGQAAAAAFLAAEGIRVKLHRAKVGPSRTRKVMRGLWDLSAALMQRMAEDAGAADIEARDAPTGGRQPTDPPIRKGGEDDPRDLPPPTIYGEELQPAENLLMFWANAFIPGDAPFSADIPDGPYAGQRMIPGPFSLTFWPFSMLPGSDCYLTDNRGFSPLRKASCRMHSLAAFDLGSAPLRWDQHHRCNRSVEVDCEDGDVEEEGYASQDNMNYRDLVGAAPTFDVHLLASGFDPVFNGPVGWVTPYIDINLKFRWVGGQKLLIVYGKVDDYPAFECYGQLGTRPTQTLFRRPVTPGLTPTALYGGPVTNVDYSIYDWWTGYNPESPGGNWIGGFAFL